MKKKIIDFNPFFLKILNLNNRIEFISKNFNDIIFSNSLSFEDSFLFYFLNLKKVNFKTFFLNTGKIFNYFFNFINKINFKKNNKIKLCFSNFFLINKFIKKYNLNSFYNNVILRKLCCYLRKIEPFNKIIYNYNILLTGQRKNRINHNLFNLDYDNVRNIIKYNLLTDWDFKDIFYFSEKFNIFLNYIYNYGYPSIGCSPCTKNVKSSDHIREGRWWWEGRTKRECGLHI